jgi:predicted nucleic acid-binding protein
MATEITRRMAMKGLFDSNILIDYLRGVKEAAKEIERFKEKYISIISYMEVLVGAPQEDITLLESIKAFLNSFTLVNVTLPIVDLTVIARKTYRLKLPDAIILASAHSLSALLVTRNSKDFPHDDPSVRIPY